MIEPSAADVELDVEALEDMLRSRGWHLFAQRVLKEWEGEGYFSRMGLAVSSPDPTEAKIIHKTAIEMKHMLKWPFDRVNELRRAR